MIADPIDFHTSTPKNDILIHQRFQRQELLLPIESLKGVTLVGAGHIGSWISLVLTQMGLGSSFNPSYLTIYDGDTLEEHNCPGGFFRESDIGKKKVYALQDLIHSINSANIVVFPEYYRNQDINDEVLILGLDSVSERLRILDEVTRQLNIRLVIDARSGWHQGEVYTFDPRNDLAVEKWRDTLKPELLEEIPCGAKAVAYNPVTIAGCVGACVRNYFMKTGLLPNKFLVQHEAMLYQSIVRI